MPKKDLERLATPRHVFDSMPSYETNDQPRPLHGETFERYAMRLRMYGIGADSPVSPSPLLTMLCALGLGKPSRHEYERRLDAVIGHLHATRFGLYDAFREG